MAQQDIPNGFTGFTAKKPKHFESARDAIEKRAREAAKQDKASADTRGTKAPATTKAAKGAATKSATSQPKAKESKSAPVPAMGLIGAEGVLATAERDTPAPAAAGSICAPALKYTTGTRGTDGAYQFDPKKLAEISGPQRRWSWVEIDLNAIRYNVSEIKRRLPAGTRLMAVVKADAYGHGAVPCAKSALNSGADYLGVATVDEAIELREHYINAPILILSQPPETAIPLLLAYKVMPSVYTPDFAIAYAEAADALGLRAPFHLAVNTGMNRIGVNHDEVVEFMRAVGFHRALDHVGTFTHFATADHEESFDFQIQLTRFAEAVNALALAGFDPGIVHAANSAAAIRFPDAAFNMVRLGIAMYGLQPMPLTRSLIQLKPAMSVKARITDVHFPSIHEGVSYGLHYRSPGNVAICTLPIGYADGLRRNLSGRLDVIKGGLRYPQVGNICMDQCMFEVDMRATPLRRPVEPAIGDEVTIVGREGNAVVTLDDMANILGTITHELAIGFGTSRMPRLYG